MAILIVDDDHELVELMSFSLQRAGFSVRVALDGPAAVEALEGEPPELVVLDIEIGAWNGVDILRGLRQHSRVPVILLTRRSGEEAKVDGLDAGADDYITKPFSYKELTARVRALLRRAQPDWILPAPSRGPVYSGGGLVLNTADHTCTRDGELLRLTNIEFRLLSHLMANAGAVVEHRELMMTVWGMVDAGVRDSLRVALRRLRTKVEVEPGRPRLLITVPGIGVMFRGP